MMNGNGQAAVSGSDAASDDKIMGALGFNL